MFSIDYNKLIRILTEIQSWTSNTKRKEMLVKKIEYYKKKLHLN